MSIPRVRLGRLGTVPGEVLPYKVQQTLQLTAKFSVIDLVHKMASISVLKHTESKTGINCVLRLEHSFTFYGWVFNLNFVQSPNLSVLNNAVLR